MKSLSRTLSMILCFQLLFGCNQFNFENRPESFIDIRGSIASTVNRIGNLLIPSAMADDGELRIYDVTNPENPIEIYYSQKINGEDYHVRIEREKVLGKTLKVSYQNYTQDKFREAIVVTNHDEKEILSDLNIYTTIRSELISSIAERANHERDYQKIMEELKGKAESHDLGLPDQEETINKLLFNTSEEASRNMRKHIAQYQMYELDGDLSEIENIRISFKKLAEGFGIKVSYYEYYKKLLDSSEEFIKLKDFDANLYTKEGEALDNLEQRYFGVRSYLSLTLSMDDIREDSAIWENVFSYLSKTMDQKVSEVSSVFEKNAYVQAIGYYKYLEEFDLSKFEDGNAAVDKLHEDTTQFRVDLHENLQTDKIDEDSEIWNVALEEIEKLLGEMLEKAEKYEY